MNKNEYKKECKILNSNICRTFFSNCNIFSMEQKGYYKYIKIIDAWINFSCYKDSDGKYCIQKQNNEDLFNTNDIVNQKNVMNFI